nr:hypothetical protein [Sporosarcina jiandibaonis]
MNSILYMAPKLIGNGASLFMNKPESRLPRASQISQDAARLLYEGGITKYVHWNC